VPLRLAIGRDGIGIELAQAVRIECLRVSELAATLPGVRFPVDVSGGVARFRHRRGELSRAEVEIRARELEAWLSGRLHGVVGVGRPYVGVSVRRAGATVCVADTGPADDERPRAIVVFDLSVVADGDDVELIVERARGTALPATPTALAMGCVSEALRALGKTVERRGAIFVVRSLARTLAAALLPEAGARVPSVDETRWSSFVADGDAWVIHAIRGSMPAAPDDGAVRAREVARLLESGDDLLAAGDQGGARGRYLEALERAPRHHEIIGRVIAIDAAATGRAEAALALLADLGDERASLGTAPGELLAAAGDKEAAVASLERSGEAEETPWLAARAFELAARWAPDADEASRLLDRALASSPRSASARWARLRRRLELGRLEDALADAEHLEALAEGPEAKHLLWLKVGRAWQEAGLARHAAAIFERALVYAPDEPRSLAGLGAALVGEGRAGRGVALLRRALDLAEAVHEPTGGIRLALGQALAEGMGDLPAAVAHVSAIPSDAHEAPVARGLEGRWRARLGDLSGAGLAFARLRELALAFEPSSDDSRVLAMVGFLREAAQVLRERMGDMAATQRHLAAALRLRPRDGDLLHEYRAVNALATGVDLRPRAGDAHLFPPSEAGSETHRTALAPVRAPLDLALARDDEDDAASAARVVELTNRLQANPADRVAAGELTALLESLRRSHELVALLFAQLEDAVGDQRALLVEQARATLQRALAAAEAEERADDVLLFRGALASLV
jgi:tetratricopeptide (TPR) repeat protein